MHRVSYFRFLQGLKAFLVPVIVCCSWRCASFFAMFWDPGPRRRGPWFLTSWINLIEACFWCLGFLYFSFNFWLWHWQQSGFCIISFFLCVSLFVLSFCRGVPGFWGIWAKGLKLVWNRSETSQNLQLTYLPGFHGTSYIGRSHDPVTLRLETQCLCQALIFIIAQGVLLSVPSRVKIFFGSSHCLLFLKMCLLLCSVLGPRRRGPWFLTS